MIPKSIQQQLQLEIDCPVVSCGNSATLGNEKIGALATDGERDPLAPFRIVVGSLVGAQGGCANRAPLSVGVEAGELVGFDPSAASATGSAIGEVLCRGEDLRGSSFRMMSGETTYTITVRGRGGVESRERVPRTLPTYDFAASSVDGAGIETVTDLCGETPVEEGSAKNLGVEKFGAPWGMGATSALLVHGERYSKEAQVLARDSKWFYIACAGTGLAKLRLLGFDPSRDWQGGTGAPGEGESSVGQRQATLKMLTGKFCGMSLTMSGTEISFARASQPVPARSSRLGPIEALWNSEGATCLSHWRLATAQGPLDESAERAMVRLIRQSCNLKPCSADAAACTTALRDERDGVWRTCTVDHLPHPQS